jgi:hypothetical protein
MPSAVQLPGLVEGLGEAVGVIEHPIATLVAGQAHDDAAGLWHHRRSLEARCHNYL